MSGGGCGGLFEFIIKRNKIMEENKTNEREDRRRKIRVCVHVSVFGFALDSLSLCPHKPRSPRNYS